MGFGFRVQPHLQTLNPKLEGSRQPNGEQHRAGVQLCLGGLGSGCVIGLGLSVLLLVTHQCLAGRRFLMSSLEHIT